MSEAGASALRRALEASHAQAERPLAAGFPADALAKLQSFQRQRLAHSYADLLAQPRHAAAARFFLDELYGGRDAAARDAQVAGALPIMERTLPGRLQHALADAFRLQGLSLELDIALALGMVETGCQDMTLADYVALYPSVPRSQRVEQIDLIERLAGELDRVVHLPLVLGLIVAMRGPARAAGFAELQAFLERGLRAFRAMGCADTFTRTIVNRERAAMERLYAGDPNPFAAEDQSGA
ncbi:MAG: hypothetical protein AAGH19_07640 [Pseudomonadota bacterium]